MEAGERTKAAFDYAKESTVQLISLATGVMALTITFSKDLIGDSETCKLVWMMKWAWGLYLGSICFGVLTLLALTGTLARGNGTIKCDSIYGFNVRIQSVLQIVLFLVATGFAAVFAIRRF